MDTPSPSQTAMANDDGWELCNDDNFTYKRRKHRRFLTAQPPVPVDPEEEEIRRRGWKRKNLIRVKEKYKKEMEDWEIMLEALNTMQDKAIEFQIQQEERRK
ncbi:hypothetical protein V6N13_104896 [Hibiscus sabdariffa]|uniref:Uncharacterized protein n=1 Tax=Hibiscus sabdariffa TaxID=183260 RepID=A0ABR2SIC7_9ROSI